MELVKACGVVGIYDKPVETLRKTVCELVAELNKAEGLRLSAMSVFPDTHSRTEWLVDDLNTSMRDVWIVKKVTEMAGTDFEKVSRDHVLLVNRSIAEGIVGLLNSQTA